MTKLAAALPRMYGDLAGWWPLVSSPGDYAEEAAWFAARFREAAVGPVRTVLELGCGGGNNASHLKSQFELTLTDVSAAMLEVSRGLNPECTHVEGDMRTLRLGREFDAVFIHDAVSYLTTTEEVRQALATAHAHCRPGGAAVIAPDFVRERFRPRTDHGGHDGGDARGLRYLEWTHDPDPDDTSYRVDFALLLRGPDGSLRAVSDRHVCGVLPRACWIDLMTAVGFRTRVVGDHWDREVFVGSRSSGPGDG